MVASMQHGVSRAVGGVIPARQRQHQHPLPTLSMLSQATLQSP